MEKIIRASLILLRLLSLCQPTPPSSFYFLIQLCVCFESKKKKVYFLCIDLILSLLSVHSLSSLFLYPTYTLGHWIFLLCPL